MEMFGKGYKDSVIAMRTGLSLRDVEDLRRSWERWEEEKMNENTLWDIELPLEIIKKDKKTERGFILGCFYEDKGIKIYLEGFFENEPTFTFFVHTFYRVIAHEIAHREILKEIRSNHLEIPDIEDEEDIVNTFCGEDRFYSDKERREKPEYFRKTKKDYLVEKWLKKE